MNFVEPIRDRKKITQIKNLLRGQYRYRDLLLFVLGINTALRISDLLCKEPNKFGRAGGGRTHTVSLPGDFKFLGCLSVEYIWRYAVDKRLYFGGEIVCREHGFCDVYPICTWIARKVKRWMAIRRHMLMGTILLPWKCYLHPDDAYPACIFSFWYLSKKVKSNIIIPDGGIPRHKITIGNSSSWLPRFDNQMKAYMLRIRITATIHTSIEVKASFIRGTLILTITDISS